MSTKSLQRSLPPMEVKSLDSRADRREAVSPQSGLPRELPVMSLQMAKEQIGGALRTTIQRTGSTLKEFGDPSHVNRVCDGDLPGPIARAWQCPVRRKALVIALAEASQMFNVITSIDEKVSA